MRPSPTGLNKAKANWYLVILMDRTNLCWGRIGFWAKKSFKNTGAIWFRGNDFLKLRGELVWRKYLLNLHRENPIRPPPPKKKKSLRWIYSKTCHFCEGESQNIVHDILKIHFGEFHWLSRADHETRFLETFCQLTSHGLFDRSSWNHSM